MSVMVDATSAVPEETRATSRSGWQDATVADLVTSARQIMAQTNGCACPDEPHQNGMHDLAHDVVRILANTQHATLVLRISRYLNSTYSPNMDPETVMWRRLTKVSEEAGEVQKALRGVTGENPRKGVTHTMEDLVDELLDCAVASLGAVEHLLDDGTSLEALDRHIVKMAERLGVAQ